MMMRRLIDRILERLWREAGKHVECQHGMILSTAVIR